MGSPQQEIIIWAIVHFVKGLARMDICPGALLCSGFLCNTLSALISYKKWFPGLEKHGIVSCVTEAESRTAQAHFSVLVQNGVNMKGSLHANRSALQK